jgi:tetratricopeptide (TPR) repeat protein
MTGSENLIDSNSFQRHMRAGDLQMGQHNYAAAIQSYREALKFKPDTAHVYSALAKCLVNEYERSKNKDLLKEAKIVARKAVDIAPQSSYCHRTLGDVLLDARENKEAKEHLQRAVDLAPNDANCHLHLGNFFFNNKRNQEALDCYHETLRLDPECAPALINIGTYLFYRAHNVAKAEEYAARALKIDPDNPDGLVLMGHILLSQGKIDQAADHARMVLSHQPDHSRALFLIAVIETRRNPLRGMGFRLAIWEGQHPRVLNLCIMVMVVISVNIINAFTGIDVPGIPCYFALFAAMAVYLRFCVTNMRRYVSENYLKSQRLHKDF